MAFCNSCGRSLAPGANVCSHCSATVAPAAVAAAAIPAPPAPGSTPPAPPAPAGGGALKIVLIAVGAVVVIGVLCIASLGFIGYRLARRAHVTRDGNHVKVETPFGSVDTNQDPEQAARDLGVEIYPGAQVQKSGAASTTFAGIHTVAANFESGDSADAVCAFYKNKYPAAIASTSDQSHCSIVFSDKQSMITINVRSSGGGTRIQISNITKNADSK